MNHFSTFEKQFINPSVPAEINNNEPIYIAVSSCQVLIILEARTLLGSWMECVCVFFHTPDLMPSIYEFNQKFNYLVSSLDHWEMLFEQMGKDKNKRNNSLFYKDGLRQVRVHV